MRFKAHLLAGFAATVLTGNPVVAGASDSPAPANTVGGVTVTAPQKPDPLVDRTTEFVRQRLPTSRFEQYARFRDPICVKVQGLPGQFDAFVAKRIVEVATEVHAPVAKAETCKPNVNVIFSAQPQALLKDIGRRREDLLGFHFMAQMKGLTTFSRPIQAWYLTQTSDMTGRTTLDVRQTGGVDVMDIVQGGADLGGGEAAGGSFGPHGRAGSRLSVEMSSELALSLIIADAGKVSGQPIGAVADYIAVLALSRWQGLERCSGLSTILNLMAQDCGEDPPQAATSSDLALLTSLYAVDPREDGALQRATIASAVRKAAETDRAH